MTINNVQSTGQSILTALNSSGGIDYSTLATNLANATELPYQQIIQSKITADNAKVTSVGKIMSSVASFQQSLTSLGDPSLLTSTPVSSDTSKVAVSTMTGASVSPNLNTNISVQQLATASSVVFNGVSSTSAPLMSSGTQTLNFTDATGASLKDSSNMPISISIDATTTLSSLNDQINKLSGFSSQIVQGGSSESPQYFLEIQHGTGQSSQFSVNFGASDSSPISASITHGQGNLDLSNGIVLGSTYSVNLPTSTGTITKYITATTTSPSDFTTALQSAFAGNNITFTNTSGQISVTYSDNTVSGSLSLTQLTSPTGGALTLNSTQEGQDAIISVDGVQASSSSNNFSNVIPGLQITALSTTVDSNSNQVPVNISSSFNSQNMTNAVATLVTGFNSLIQTLTTETKYNSDPTQAGALDNNTEAKSLISQLRNFTTAPIAGQTGQAYYLSELGISTNLDGTLSLDSSTLSNILSTNPSLVANIVGSFKSTDTNGVSIGVVGTNTVPGYYQLQKKSDGWYLGGIKATQMPGAIQGASGSAVDGLLIDMSSSDQAAAAIGFTANISYSQGMVEQFTNLMTSLTQATSSINQISTNAQSDITTQQTAQTNLDAKTTQQQQRYLNQFSALNTYLMNAQSTQSNLTNMMSAWSSVLKQ